VRHVCSDLGQYRYQIAFPSDALTLLNSFRPSHFSGPMPRSLKICRSCGAHRLVILGRPSSVAIAAPA
jgi:hypothetical protein